MLDKIFKPNDPVITYNHMQEENMEKGKSNSGSFSKFKDKLIIWFIAEEIMIALLLALIFYMI